MEKYCKFGALNATEGNGEKLRDILLQAAEELETVESCQCYIVGMNEEEPDSVYVYEVWDDKAAHEASLQLPETKKLIKEAMPILDTSDMRQDYPDLAVYGGKASL